MPQGSLECGQRWRSKRAAQIQSQILSCPHIHSDSVISHGQYTRPTDGVKSWRVRRAQRSDAGMRPCKGGITERTGLRTECSGGPSGCARAFASLKVRRVRISCMLEDRALYPIVSASSLCQHKAASQPATGETLCLTLSRLACKTSCRRDTSEQVRRQLHTCSRLRTSCNPRCCCALTVRVLGTLALKARPCAQAHFLP